MARKKTERLSALSEGLQFQGALCSPGLEMRRDRLTAGYPKGDGISQVRLF